jgi:hypothetical protein
MWFIGKLINESGNEFKVALKELLGSDLQAVVKDLSTVEESYARVTQKYIEQYMGPKVIERKWLREKIDDPFLNPGSFFYKLLESLNPIDHPLTVYDLFRCRKFYDSGEELCADLLKLNARYPIVRIKNKTNTPLSLVFVNFAFDFHYDGSKGN